MLTASPAVMAPDSLLPGRDRLMDAEEFGLRIASALGPSAPLGVERCERIKAKYRIGESLRVLHRIRVSGVWYVVAARMFAAGPSTRSI